MILCEESDDSVFTDNTSLFQEYITMLVCNGKSQRQAREDLDAFLGEQSWEFVAWFVLLSASPFLC